MNRRGTAGISLVEMLVSLSLGVMLCSVVATAYVFAKREFHLYQQLARMQENGRYALRLLGRELAMSGFHGALPVPQDVLGNLPGTACADGWALDTGSTVQVVNDFVPGTVDAATDLMECVDPSVILQGTDVLAVKRTAGGAAVSDGDVAAGLMSSATRRWYLKVRAGEDAYWEKLSATQLRTLETGPDTNYWRAMASVFFIRPYAVEEGDEIPTLCAEILAGQLLTVRCFAEGVEDLQVQFAVDTDGDGVADRYLDDAADSDISSAVSARIFLLIRSLEPVYGYRDLERHAVGHKVREYPGKGFVRQVLSTTVPLDSRPGPLG